MTRSPGGYKPRVQGSDVRKYIAFEGLDGAGKSTVRKYILSKLRQEGPFVLATGPHSWLVPRAARVIVDLRENRAQYARDVIRNSYFDDRMAYQKNILRPMLAKYDVIADRSAISDAVYQEALHGAVAEQILSDVEEAKLTLPDLVVYLRVPPDIAVKRISRRGDRVKHYENLSDLAKIDAVYERVLSASGWWTGRGGIIRLNNVPPIERACELALKAVRESLGRA